MVSDRNGHRAADYHFVGVGGIGMSALAQILVAQGHRVSGSDLADNTCTRRLARMGVQLYRGHAAENLQGSPQVVYSTAIQGDNPELTAAIARNLPICHRADILAQLVNPRLSIGVAGTHGKTTTSSIIGYMLLQAGLDPTVVIGGEVEAWQGNARTGKGEYLVAEVDESDGSLVKLHPTIGAIVNIELDHPDRYHSLEQVVEVFQQYANQCQVVVGCLDCPAVAEHIPVDLGYSLNGHPDAAYWASDARYTVEGIAAQIWERGEQLGELRLKLLGEHNLSNALAAVAVGRHLGLSFEAIASALAQFGGARRRFELKGVVSDVQFVDDYAHHPTEIAATLAAAQTQQRRVVAVFQPHRYTRMASLFHEFAAAFRDADVVVVVPVYSAGEDPLPCSEELSAEALVRQMHRASLNGNSSNGASPNGNSSTNLSAGVIPVPEVFYEGELAALPERLSALLEPDDLVLFLGAGNLNCSIPTVMNAYRSRLACEAGVLAS
jgi:UDP-N-acetylmuramate--alanine ligase